MSQQQWWAAEPATEAELADWVRAGQPLWAELTQLGSALKEAAHAALSTDLPRAARLSQALILLGEQGHQPALVALGTMALGDSYRLALRYNEGYALLDQAAALFEVLDDPLGWARTRIGWMGDAHTQPISDLDATLKRAAQIFREGNHLLWLSMLLANYTRQLHLRRAHAEVVEWAKQGVAVAQRMEPGPVQRHRLVVALAMQLEAENSLGALDAAEATLATLRPLADTAPLDPVVAVECDVAIGRFYLNSGRYSQALRHFHQAARHPLGLRHEVMSRFYLASTFRRLNRLDALFELLPPLLQRIHTEAPASEWEWLIRLRLAQAHCGLNQLAEARATLEPAIQQGATGDAVPLPWVAEMQREYALLLHRQGEGQAAQQAAQRALDATRAGGGPMNLAEAYLLMATVAPSAQAQQAALTWAHEAGAALPWLCWRVHALEARRAPSADARLAALERAAHDLDQVQSTLAASYHASFLAEAESLYHELIAAWMARGESARAWSALERAKSRALANAMLVRETLAEQPPSPLQGEVERLQQRHFVLISAHLEGNVAWGEVAAVEQALLERQRELEVEQLGRREPLEPPPPLIPCAPQGHDLVGYYLTDEGCYAFVHDGRQHHHLPLPISSAALGGLLQELSVNMESFPAMPATFAGAALAQLHRILEALDRGLLAPLRPLLRHERLIVVPHGALHQLPWHLLRADGRYLLERCALRIVPTARLALDDAAPTPGRGALVVSHDCDGMLAHTCDEGDVVAALLPDSRHLSGDAATRRALLAAMEEARVLHIATHGEHRMDAPELSFVQLSDGMLTFGDLMHRTIRASLVTLSACETGQVVVRAGDDPVGLWRAFLAAGARSLLVSLWRLRDDVAVTLMEEFYGRLVAGASKGDALRATQLAWLARAEGSEQHPFFWGALQLIGDDGPL